MDKIGLLFLEDIYYIVYSRLLCRPDRKLRIFEKNIIEIYKKKTYKGMKQVHVSDEILDVRSN